MRDFIHLHNHTHYSLLDAAATPEQLIKAAIADEQKAVALTDHGVMFGAYEFFKKAKAKGIKPIIGFEAYVANTNRFDRSRQDENGKKKHYRHLVLLAKNEEGYRNLIRLTSLGHIEGFYYKPRIDRELLELHHNGIIALSACLGGVVNADLVNGDYEAAYETSKYYKDLFGDDFYLEMQNHGLPEDPIIMEQVPRLGRELGIKIVATNDCHYIKKDHAVSHNVLLNIRDATSANSGQTDIYNLHYKVPEMYFKSQEEMNKLFIDHPEALDTTLEIAEKCEFAFKKELQMPVFPIPQTSKAQNLDELLIEETYKGLNKRYKEITPAIKERVDYELGVIIKMGFPGYFLIVQDFIRAAREMGVSVGPGRGSAAGSIVAYCLWITNVDPLPYDLLFERFLNPERVSMPDIDIDFADDKREMVIDYVKRKYGASSVAQIVTFNTLSTKAVIKDVGRVLGVPLSTVNSINSKIPTIQGKVTKIEKALDLPDLKWLKDSDERSIQELIEHSMNLEGLARNTGIHAAGVVIAPADVINFVPLYQAPSLKDEAGSLISQYNMKDIEDAGLLKMDFLGLRTLSIIENALDMIEKNYGERIDVDAIDFHDKDTYDMLSNGQTLSIFQFESSGMQEYLKQLKPNSLEELTAMNALYRPGPMANIPDFIDRKFGRKEIEYLHPLMEGSLKATYGIIVYQEQVMKLGQEIAGFSLAQADIMRRAMGKKDDALMAKMGEEFAVGAEKNGIPKDIAKQIFELIHKFASYGFNKSHSLAYSYLAYQTAWLKAHYPAEFLAANMSAELNDLDKIVQLMDEAAKLNITVLPIDVNKSDIKFVAKKGEIVFGMAAVKNVGEGAVEAMKIARAEAQFTSFHDFVSRVDAKGVNKRTLEALISVGAFDNIADKKRASLIAGIDAALEFAKACAKGGEPDMDSLFGDSVVMKPTEPALPKVPEWTEKERLEKEKEFLNFYISGHPLEEFYPIITSASTVKLNDEENPPQGGQNAVICGMLSQIRSRVDKRGNKIAFPTIENFDGKAELIMWSEAFEKFGAIAQADEIVIAIGKLDQSEEVKLVVDELIKINEAPKFIKGVKIKVWADEDPHKITDLNLMLDRKFQPINFKFQIFERNNGIKSEFMADLNFEMTMENLKKISTIFGKKNISLDFKFEFKKQEGKRWQK